LNENCLFALILKDDIFIICYDYSNDWIHVKLRIISYKGY